jgi:hypothetical protein
VRTKLSLLVSNCLVTGPPASRAAGQGPITLVFAAGCPVPAQSTAPALSEGPRR